MADNTEVIQLFSEKQGVKHFFDKLSNLNHEIIPNSFGNKYSFDLFGLQFIITDSIITMWIIMAILILMAFVTTRKLDIIPSKIQNFVEVVVDAINKMTKDILHAHWKSYAPYIGTVILFLVASNTISIFNFLPYYSLRPPTKDINTTLALALMSISLVIGSAIRYKSFVGWIKSFVKPIPVMLPFNILEYFIKPLSLCMRLFGNILAAYCVMEIVYFFAGSMSYLGIPTMFPAIGSMYFDLFDGLLQAYIFTFLTLLYVEEAIE